MTPDPRAVEALAEALGAHPQDPELRRDRATAILTALPEEHRQAWADGLALARLRKALPRGRGFTLAGDGPGYVIRVNLIDGSVIEAWSACDHLDYCACPPPTIAAAVEAALAALEAP